MKILIDMDDVMEDLLGAWLDWLNKKYNILVTKSDIKTWSMHKCFEKYVNDGTMNVQDIYDPLYTSEFWDTVKPKDNAVELVKMLNDKYEIYVATASHYKTIESKVDRCLFKYFDFLNWNQVITIHNKSMLRGDVLIDDNYDNIKSFVESSDNAFGILVTAEYNKNEELSNRMFRANTWGEIVRLVNMIDYEKKVDDFNLGLVSYDEVVSSINKRW